RIRLSNQVIGSRLRNEYAGDSKTTDHVRCSRSGAMAVGGEWRSCGVATAAAASRQRQRAKSLWHDGADEGGVSRSRADGPYAARTRSRSELNAQRPLYCACDCGVLWTHGNSQDFDRVRSERPAQNALRCVRIYMGRSPYVWRPRE